MGGVLNDFLLQSHNNDGTLKDIPVSKVTGLQSNLDAKVSSSSLNAALDTKANTSDLSNVATSGSYDDLINKPNIPEINYPVTSVNTKAGDVTLTKADVGLAHVDNTADADKPVSTATQTVLSSKQDTLVSGTNLKTINGSSLLGSGNVVAVNNLTIGSVSTLAAGSNATAAILAYRQHRACPLVSREAPRGILARPVHLDNRDHPVARQSMNFVVPVRRTPLVHHPQQASTTRMYRAHAARGDG
ncbi:MAG: hypothetical protein WAW91_03160 [Candidatus Nanoperiomorbaceae bacterium]